MRKFLTLFCLLGVLVPAAAGKPSPKLPDNIYFRAMQDEMKRTLQELRAKDSPNPYYVAYKLMRTVYWEKDASFGELYPSSEAPQTRLDALVLLGIGSDKSDQLGFASDHFYYEPQFIKSVPNSYEGIRRALWERTNAEYLAASDAYVQKQAYKRQKALPDTLPDVTPAPQAAVFEDAEEFSLPDMKKWEETIKKLSAKGKDLSWIENFTVSFKIEREETYYLNSLGGAYQIPFTKTDLKLKARFRNQDGYLQEAEDTIQLAGFDAPDEKALEEKTDAFLVDAAQMYNAYKAEAYLGPVLFRPAAAAQFVQQQFVWNVENVKPLLSNRYENDESSGLFRDKKGMRVISNVVDVIDKPLLREYQGKPLVFMPVDDEGVPSQNLQLTSQGRLRVLPQTRRPLGENHQSNGHARMNFYTYPRESLTNTFVEPKMPLSEKELEEEFLAVCQDWELEYCYQIDVYENINDSLVNRAWRVYAQDGRKVPAFGLDLRNLYSRSLRDIIAAGDDKEVIYFQRAYGPSTIVSPSLLLEEIEILPSDVKPDKPPFIDKP